LLLEGGPDATASIMTADDDVLDLKHFYCELNNGKTIYIGVIDEIGNVPVNENLTRH
jgi:hypothetical protein